MKATFEIEDVDFVRMVVRAEIGEMIKRLGGFDAPAADSAPANRRRRKPGKVSAEIEKRRAYKRAWYAKHKKAAG